MSSSWKDNNKLPRLKEAKITLEDLQALNLDKFLGCELKAGRDGHSPRWPYLYGRTGNIGFMVWDNNGSVEIQCTENHPYDEANYVWAKCLNAKNLNKWVFISNGSRIAQKDDIQSGQEVIDLLKRYNSAVEPAMSYN